jgi:hypothetical protein
VVPKVTLVGDNVHARPDGVDADTDRLTVPVNPFRGVTVMVEVPDDPANIWLGVTALAEMLKSFCGENVTETVRVSVPLVPLTVTVKATVQVPPAVSAAVFGVGSVTLVGEMVFVQPVGGVVVIVRAMLPVKPLSAFAVIVEVELPGGLKLTVDGLAPRLKSTTWKRMLAVVWDNVPSVPVTVTV